MIFIPSTIPINPPTDPPPRLRSIQDGAWTVNRDPYLETRFTHFVNYARSTCKANCFVRNERCVPRLSSWGRGSISSPSPSRRGHNETHRFEERGGGNLPREENSWRLGSNYRTNYIPGKRKNSALL